MKKTILLLLLSMCIFSCQHENRLWEDATVYYEFHKGFSVAEKAIVLECMNHWNARTGLQFKPMKVGKHYVTIFKSDVGGSATIGCSTINVMRVSFSKYRFITNKLIYHELGHVIGLQHEHQRPDRDKHIRVNYKNITAGNKDNFVKIPKREFMIKQYRHQYDYKSVMHYSSWGFSKKNTKTLTHLNGDDIEYTRDITDTDALKVKSAYFQNFLLTFFNNLFMLDNKRG